MFSVRVVSRPLAVVLGIAFLATALSAQVGNTSANSVKCKDGTIVPKSPSTGCDRHGGPMPHTGAVAVTAAPASGSEPSKTGAVVVNAAPAAGVTTTPAHKKSNAHGTTPVGESPSKGAVAVNAPPAGGTKVESGGTGAVAVNAAPAGGAAGAHPTGGVANTSHAATGGTNTTRKAGGTTTGGAVAVTAAPATTSNPVDNSANRTTAGATARCNDGTYSHTHSHGLACKGHEGVNTWITSNAEQ
jgi:hypothetical protein